jgi:MEMO1 family protein
MELNSKYIDRPPIAAGRFYSAHAEKLEIEIGKMIGEAEKELTQELPSSEDLLAIIAPHAGYIFSGTVAASAFLQLRNIKPRKNIFILGSSHHTDFNGASIYNLGDYLTPFGKVKVNLEIANKIIQSSKIIDFVQVAHAHEHSIEVLLPFIQYFWHNDFQIIPVILATHSVEICSNLAKELQVYFTHENLFVVSTDLSHYPSFSNALKVDKATIEAVMTGEPDNLIEQIAINKHNNIPNLVTSMCGWTSVITLMHMAQKLCEIDYVPLLYQNSGNSVVFGEKDRVVGYQSMALYRDRKKGAFILSEEDKQNLLNTARNSILHYLAHGEKYIPKPKEYTKNLQESCGAFVSLHKNDELRGCIGRIDPGDNSLIKVVADISVSAAFYDSRFSPVTKDETQEIKIEVSILTPLQKIESIEEIELGKHGIYIRKGFYSGTYLPQVAQRTGWTREEFLGYCSKNKVGIGWEGWREAEIFIYEAIVINEA